MSPGSFYHPRPTPRKIVPIKTLDSVFCGLSNVTRALFLKKIVITVEAEVKCVKISANSNYLDGCISLIR